MRWERERRYPEQDEEEARARHEREEREIDRADYIMDEIKDRRAEQRDEEMEDDE